MNENEELADEFDKINEECSKALGFKEVPDFLKNFANAVRNGMISPNGADWCVCSPAQAALLTIGTKAEYRSKNANRKRKRNH